MSDERKGLPSASEAYRWINCPGSFKMPKKQDEPGEAAKRGTAMHDYFETGNFGDLNKEEIAIVDKANDIIAEFIEETFRGKPTKIIREERWFYKNGAGNEIFSGKADVIYIFDRTALIVDLKTGMGEVESADKNRQLQALTILLQQKYPNVSEVYTMLVHPAVFGDLYSVARYSLDDIGTLKMIIPTAAWRANQEHQPKMVGEQCRYCKSYDYCDAPKVQALLVPDNNQLTITPELLGRIKDAETLLKKLKDESHKKAIQMLENNSDAIPGWKLRAGRKTQTVTDPQEACRVMMKEGLDPEQFSLCCAVSIPKLADTYKANNPEVNKVNARRKVEGLLSEVIEERVSSPILAKK